MMKVKIFMELLSEMPELERKMNRFMKDKHIVGIHQSVCCGTCSCDSKKIIMTVLYYEHYCHTYCNTCFK